MDPVFRECIAQIAGGDIEGLRATLAADPTLATRRSSCGHPTLLQMVACEASDLPDAAGAARVLLAAGAEAGGPLVAAASVDARGVLLLLLEHGIDVDGEAPWTPLDEALYWNHADLAAELVARGAKIGTLRAAAGLGRCDLIHGFFVEGSPIPEAGPIRSPFPDTVPTDRATEPADIIDNAFVTAVNNGQVDAAKLLLDHGARVNAKPPGFHWRGAALHAAVWRGHRPLVSWLLFSGADANLRDDLANADAVGWAEHHGHTTLAAHLRGLEP